MGGLHWLGMCGPVSWALVGEWEEVHRRGGGPVIVRVSKACDGGPGLVTGGGAGENAAGTEGEGEGEVHLGPSERGPGLGRGRGVERWVSKSQFLFLGASYVVGPGATAS